MMNPIRRMFPEAKVLSMFLAAPLLLAGVTFTTGCSEDPPPPPPPPPPVVQKEKPKSRPVSEMITELEIDSRIHMDEELAHRYCAIRAAGLLFVQAMLEDDRALAKRLSGTDASVEGMLANPAFADARAAVERVDLEFGRVFGEDAMLVIWEFPEHLSAQMWVIAGPVPSGEAAFYWPGYSNEFTKSGEAEVSTSDNWSWSDGSQVALFAAPGLPNMIDNLGEKPFEDWSNMVASWHETALQPDLVLKVLDINGANNNEGDGPTGGGQRPQGFGGGGAPAFGP